MQLRHLPTALAASMVLASSLRGQTTTAMATGSGGSPHQKTTWTVNGATVAVEYGRPYLKGRPEAQMMPPGQPWRTGADQATVLTTDKPLVFGTVKLAPGSYTINTQPGEKSWQLILGKLGAAGQWGVPYLENLEIGRAPMTLTRSAKTAEQVTISILTPASGPVLRVEWGTAVASTPFRVGS